MALASAGCGEGFKMDGITVAGAQVRISQSLPLKGFTPLPNPAIVVLSFPVCDKLKPYHSISFFFRVEQYSIIWRYITFSLYIHHLMDFWVVSSTFWLLRIIPSFWNHLHSLRTLLFSYHPLFLSKSVVPY